MCLRVSGPVHYKKGPCKQGLYRVVIMEPWLGVRRAHRDWTTH